MDLTGYGCPRCGYVADNIGGARTADGRLQVKCPVCRHVETLEKVRRGVVGIGGGTVK